MEVVGHGKKRVIWGVVDDHVLEEPTDHEEIGLQGFDFNVFDKDEEGVVRKGSSELPYLLIFIKVCTGDCIIQLKMMNQKVGEDNEKALNKVNVQYRKVCWFSSNEFWKNISCIVSDPTFGLGGSRLLYK